MSCQLNELEIQSWLDGDTDQTQHLSECTDCQHRMQAVQKLRSRLTPPPSPLGRDFARRTAQHVLRVTDVVKTQKPPTSWWGRLRDNPLVHIVQRERNRRMLRLPNLAALLLLYLIPAGYCFQYGDVDARWAYFGMLQLGLTVLVPLFLLSLEWVTLSALVRGRCLEEVLQTGLEPVLVSDTLALQGLRSLIPALLVTAVALLPVHPQGLLQWLPMTLLAFSASGYLSQAHLLALKWPRWLTFVGVGAVAGSLGAPAPWNLVSALALGLLGYAARRQSVASLELQQQGRLPARILKRPSGSQQWLARRLPDLALLQRELRRRNLLTPSILVGNLGILAASYTMFGRNAYFWPFFAAASALLASFSLVNREKEAGAYEVLVHSGLKFPDWWASAAWIAGLQLAPACLAAGVVTFQQQWADGLFSSLAASLGTILCLLASLRAGAVIGASVGLTSVNSRQAVTRCVQEVAIIIGMSLLILGLLPAFLGSGSPLVLFLGRYGMNLDQLLTGLAILPVTLALHFRSRSLNGLKSGFLNPWTTALALGVPLCLWFQVNLTVHYQSSYRANFCAGLLTLVGLAWGWWAAPLARRPGLKRWAALTASYALLVLPVLPLLHWWVALSSPMQGEQVLDILVELRPWLLLLYIVAVACLVYPLGRRLGWVEQPANGSFRRRSLAAVLILGTLTASVAATFYGMARAPLTQAGRFSSFLSENSPPANLHAGLLKDFLKAIQAHSYYEPYSNHFLYEASASDLRLGSPDRIANPANLEPKAAEFDRLLRQMEAKGTLLDRLYAFRILDVQLDQSLSAKNAALVLRRLESMTLLCGQAQRGRLPAARSMTGYLRSRMVVALRSQNWSLAQLQEIERLQGVLVDDEPIRPTYYDQEAVKYYKVICQGSWGIDHPTDFVTEWYRKKQAELFLDAYLTGKRRASDQTISGLALSDIDQGRNRQMDARAMALVMGQEVVTLERWRLRHGHYPQSWRSRSSGLRMAYHLGAEGYTLKIWMHRPDGKPLALTSRARGLQMRDY